eukprot:6197078-Pleurochrysis_carterae.AAC.1
MQIVHRSPILALIALPREQVWPWPANVRRPVRADEPLHELPVRRVSWRACVKCAMARRALVCPK